MLRHLVIPTALAIAAAAPTTLKPETFRERFTPGDRADVVAETRMSYPNGTRVIERHRYREEVLTVARGERSGVRRSYAFLERAFDVRGQQHTERYLEKQTLTVGIKDGVEVITPAGLQYPEFSVSLHHGLVRLERLLPEKPVELDQEIEERHTSSSGAIKATESTRYRFVRRVQEGGFACAQIDLALKNEITQPGSVPTVLTATGNVLYAPSLRRILQIKISSITQVTRLSVEGKQEPREESYEHEVTIAPLRIGGRVYPVGSKR